MKKNKIAIVSPSLSGGGAQKIAVNLANHYSTLGFSVDLVLFRAEGEYLHQVSDAVNVVDLKLKVVRFTFGLYAVIPLRKYLKTQKPDAVLSVIRGANTNLGFASIGLKKIQIVFREANTMHDTLAKHWLIRMVDLLIMRFSYKKADRIIANSEGTKSDLIKKRIVSKNKILVIPNPVLNNNYLEISKEPVNNNFINDRKTKTILSIGRLHRQKNYPLLIKAFKTVNNHNKDTRLIIIGQGDEKEALEKMIKELHLTEVVNIEGFKQNIYPYLRKADVFALSSSWEGFGNVIVEALAMGKPVVCTNCQGGPKYILDNGRYGKLVPVDSAELFAEAIIESLGEAVDAETLIARAKEFSVEKIAEDYLRVIMQDA